MIHSAMQLKASILKEAFAATSRKRNSNEMIIDAGDILTSVAGNSELLKQWNTYRANNYYVGNLTWQDVNTSVYELAQMLQIV